MTTTFITLMLWTCSIIFIIEEIIFKLKREYEVTKIHNNICNELIKSIILSTLLFQIFFVIIILILQK